MSGHYRQVLVFDPLDVGAGFELASLLVIDDDDFIQLGSLEAGNIATAHLNGGTGFTFQGPTTDHSIKVNLTAGGTVILTGIVTTNPGGGETIFIPESNFDLESIASLDSYVAGSTTVFSQAYADYGFVPASDFPSTPATNFDDILYSTAGANIEGKNGNDILIGVSGNYQFFPGEGADTIINGGSAGLVNYNASAGAVFVNLFTGSGSGGDASGDTYLGIRDVVGTSSGDFLAGDDNFGVGVANSLFGLGGNDFFEGGGGGDYIDGGDGVDTIVFERSFASVQITLNSVGASSGVGGHATGDTYENIENISGSSFGDILGGNNQQNEIFGLNGDDQIFGSAGGDLLDGGNGIDWLIFRQPPTPQGVMLNLSTGIAGGAAAGTTFFNFENLEGTNLHDDQLTGNMVDNILDGNDGNDTLSGMAGDDTLQGEGGNDILIGGLGADELQGGSGNDTLIVNAGDELGGPEAYVGDFGTDILVFQGGAGTVVHDLTSHRVSTMERLQFGTIATGGDRSIIMNSEKIIANGFSPTGEIIGLEVAGSVETLQFVMGTETSSSFSALQFTDWGGQGEIVRIIGDDDDETITGTTVADEIFGNGGNDDLGGAAGADSLYGQANDDTIRGGSGNDTINGGGGVDDLYGDADDDAIFGGVGNDSLNGGGGADQLFGQDGDDNMLGGNGDDTLDGGAGNDSLFGQADVDTLRGNVGDDMLNGGGGNDFLFGQAGNDTIFGGTGDDLLTGGGGADILYGEDGADRLFGGGGNDQLYGGAGDDLVVGNSEIDIVDGGAGADTVLGDAGNDTLLGNAGDDVLDGGADDDNIFGQADNDRLLGNNGNDTLGGGGGNDELFGQAGTDTLDGGTGNDSLGGGGGTDSFVFLAGWGQDTITDFADGIEKANVSGAGVSAGAINVATVGANAVVDFGGTDTITFVGQAGNIDATDFIF